MLPIAKALRSEYFYRAIKNECFKVVNRDSGKQYFDYYTIYHKTNEKNIEELELSLKGLFINTSINTIKIKNIREYKVFEDLTRIYKKVDIRKISQGQILKVSNYNVYLLYKNANHKEAVKEFIDKISHKTNLKIIDTNIGSFTNKMYFQVEDSIKNKYNFYIFSESEYTKVKIGTTEGQNLDKIDEENINDLDKELIKVLTRSKEVLYISKYSTVLDFAFKIHRDIGFAFKYAIINDGKTKFPPYTKLNENDKVEIVIDKDEKGNLKNNATLKWFAYVNTELARKILIKYFEKEMR